MEKGAKCKRETSRLAVVDKYSEWKGRRSEIKFSLGLYNLAVKII